MITIDDVRCEGGQEACRYRRRDDGSCHYSRTSDRWAR